MKVSNPSHIYLQRTAIACGMGIVIVAGLAAAWYLNPRNHCVRTLSTGGKAVGGQEVVYSWGCIQPQRFRQWSVVAMDDFSEKREF